MSLLYHTVFTVTITSENPLPDDLTLCFEKSEYNSSQVKLSEIPCAKGDWASHVTTKRELVEITSEKSDK